MQLAAIMNHLLIMKTQLLTIQNKHLRRKKLLDHLFGNSIYPVGLPL